MASRNLALFALMCLIWGATWIPIKTGVEAVPPLQFAALRFLAAGTVLLLLARRRGAWLWPHGAVGRVFVAALLINTGCYSFLFWGMQHVATGLAAVINLSLMPVALFAIAVLMGEEAFSPAKAAALVLGVVGLAVLFAPRIAAEGARAEIAGMAAIVAGTLSYCLGSVLSRRLMGGFGALHLSGLHSLAGGAGLAVLALLFEPLEGAAVSAFLSPPVLLSWAFLVAGGSVVAFTAYLRLLRDWGPSRAALYAFVSPVVALAIGASLRGETIGAAEALGAALMLIAAGLALGIGAPGRGATSCAAGIRARP